MNKKNRTVRISPRTRYQRPIITDVLPFEVPPSFSNGGLFFFLTKYDVRIIRKGKGGEPWLQWEANGSEADTALSVLFNVSSKGASDFIVGIDIKDGKRVHVRSWKLKSSRTIPFHFRISHKESEFRQLSIPHPQNQLLVADFYNRFGSAIIYQCTKSNFSIRHPASIAKTARFKDRLFNERNVGSVEGIEQQNQEYENIGSYFTYRSYSNIFKFYDNNSYLNAEKKFGRLLKLDISGCFDSIYTHSIVWSVIGNEATKESLSLTTNTFGAHFDSLMQQMNRGETNGIIIGPEFSRVFAEIILQETDRKLENSLLREHHLRNKVDYEIFRYVDDYFVFTNDINIENLIKGHLGTFLKEVKLNLSSEKSHLLERPIITPLTMAKNKISSIFSQRILINESEKDDPDASGQKVKQYSFSVQAKPLITDFKSALQETGVKYKDVLNYTLASMERRVGNFFSHYEKNHINYRNQADLTNSLVGILEFSFFVYSASPRVNFSVRLTRIVANTVDSLHRLNLNSDTKDHIIKYIFDNIFRHVKVTPHDRFHEVETLYLLLAINKLGRSYSIPEDVLANFLGIRINEDGSYSRDRRMSYFAISVCLLVIRNRRRYIKLKVFIEKEIEKKFIERPAYIRTDAELIIAFLDLQSCPFVSTNTKNKLSNLYGFNSFETPFLTSVTPHWFTNWGNFDLSRELDKKRSREVY